MRTSFRNTQHRERTAQRPTPALGRAETEASAKSLSLTETVRSAPPAQRGAGLSRRPHPLDQRLVPRHLPLVPLLVSGLESSKSPIDDEERDRRHQSAVEALEGLADGGVEQGHLVVVDLVG